MQKRIVAFVGHIRPRADEIVIGLPLAIDAGCMVENGSADRASVRQRTDLAGKIAQTLQVAGRNVTMQRPIDVMGLLINASMAT